MQGVYYIASSKGYLLGKKSYVKFDDIVLIIKTIAKEKKVLWQNVEAIDLSDGKIKILPEDKNFQFVSLSVLDEECVLEIIKEISKASHAKGIRVLN